MRETSGKGYETEGVHQDDALLKEMFAWIERLTESGVSKREIAQLLSVSRSSIDRVLRDRSWTARSKLYRAWEENHQDLLLLDIGGTLALLEAADEPPERRSVETGNEPGGGVPAEHPEIATGSGSITDTQTPVDCMPVEVSKQSSEVLMESGTSEAEAALTDGIEDEYDLLEEEIEDEYDLLEEEIAVHPDRPQETVTALRLFNFPVDPTAVEPDDTASAQDETATDSDTGCAVPAVKRSVNDSVEQGIEDEDEEQEWDTGGMVRDEGDDANSNEEVDVASPDEGQQSASESANRSEKSWLIEGIRDAETIEEVAELASASVLNWAPGLTLEQAKEAAVERLGGWNPADPGRKKLPYLLGDAPLLLWTGQEVSYQDEGAREVAFAPTLEWQGEQPFCAQEMRYGIGSDIRQRRYAVAAHDEKERGLLLGYRLCGWAPETPYPDSDWFFGSEGNLRRDGTWWPSRAEALEYWYHLRGMFNAYRGTEAERTESIWFAELEKAMTITERFLLDEDYRITFYYHGKDREIPHHTRIAERRWMGKRIVELYEGIRRKHRRKRIRKVVTAPIRALGRSLLRSREQSFSQRFYEAQTKRAVEAAQSRSAQERANSIGSEPIEGKPFSAPILPREGLAIEQLSKEQLDHYINLSGAKLAAAKDD